MARPLKTGIDYFPFDVNFFSDIKIRRIVMACGASSTSVIICLLCNIYQDKGYYIKWNKDLPFLIADAVGVSEGATSEIITKAIQVGLFDEEVFNQYKVLTSEGIQQRYLTATERRKKIDWKQEYLLGALKEQFNEAKNIVNVSNNPVNDNRSTQSKVKEIKEKNISPLPEEIVRGGDFFNSIIPSDDGVERNWDRFKEILRGYQCSEKDFITLCALSNYGAIYLYAKDVWNGRIEASDIEKAWAIWLITNGSFAGSMHGGWKWCNGTAGSHSAIFLRNKRIDFSQQLYERLECVQISCRDAIRVIKERDSEHTLFYLDPPYPGSFQGHYLGYTHKDLFELLQVLSQIKGKFILSNYWCQTLRFHILKFGWNFKKIEVNLKVANLGNSPLKTREEILVYNYDIEKTLFDL